MTEAAVVSELARQATEPHELEPGTLYAIPGADGGLEVVDTRPFLDRPVRAIASPTVRDAASFVEYWEKHAATESEIYADTEHSKVVGVVNAHEGNGGAAGYRDHTVTLALVHTKPWLTWLRFNGVPMSQVDFANHIEENAIDVVDPTAAEFLDMAQSLQGSTKVDWKSAERLSTGEVKFGYEETSTARAGQKGDIEIPAEFKLALRPYVGGTVYKVGARFRYKISGNGELTMTYLLDRPEAVLEAAFIDMVDSIRDGVEAEEAIPAVPATATTPAKKAVPAVAFRAPVGHPIYFGKP